MQTFFSSISAVALIFMMAAVGYFCGRAGWFTHAHKGFLVKFIMNLAMPCMCVSSLLGSVTHALLASAGPLLLVPLCVIPLLALLAFALGKLLRVPHRRFGVFMVMCATANSMFIGYPMCTALFGDAATPYVLCYYIVNTSFFQIAGVALLNLSGRPLGASPALGKSLKSLIKPPIIAIVASVALILLDLTLPNLFLRFAKTMGNTVSPLGLLYTGFVIYELGLKNIRMDASLWVMVGMRFIAAPLLCVLFCRFFGVEGIARSVLMIEIAMPVMTQVVVLSADAGADETYAAVGTAASTLGCFAAIPLLMALAA